MRSTLLLSLKVLQRRPFFTFVSLFGIAFTLTTLLVVSALIDSVLASRAPEIHQHRTLYLERVTLSGDRSEHSGGAGYGLLDHYLRDIPRVETTTFFTDRTTKVTFVDGRRVQTALRRADTEYWRAFRFDFIEGGPFTQDDDRSARPVVVIDESTRRDFFGDDRAMGRSIDLDGRDYEVVGVVRDVDPSRNASVANAWAPLSSDLREDWRTAQRGNFTAAFVAESASAFDEIRAELASRLDQWEPTPGLPFETVTLQSLTRFEEVAGEITGTLGRAEGPDVTRLLIVGSLCGLLFMLLPAVNLINVNMSRIYERASEIGVRKAFGASNGALLRQFVTENVVLCVLGGSLSFLIAGLIAQVVARAGWLGGVQMELNLRVFAVGLALSLFFGLLSGLVPAWRMARLHPIQALRGGER